MLVASPSLKSPKNSRIPNSDQFGKIHIKIWTQIFVNLYKWMNNNISHDPGTNRVTDDDDGDDNGRESMFVMFARLIFLIASLHCPLMLMLMLMRLHSDKGWSSSSWTWTIMIIMMVRTLLWGCWSWRCNMWCWSWYCNIMVVTLMGREDDDENDPVDDQCHSFSVSRAEPKIDSDYLSFSRYLSHLPKC